MYILYRAITQTPILSSQKNPTGRGSITLEALKASNQKSLAGIGKRGLISISRSWIVMPAQEEIQTIEAELAKTQKELNQYLEELGL